MSLHNLAVNPQLLLLMIMSRNLREVQSEAPIPQSAPARLAVNLAGVQFTGRRASAAPSIKGLKDLEERNLVVFSSLVKQLGVIGRT